MKDKILNFLGILVSVLIGCLITDAFYIVNSKNPEFSPLTINLSLSILTVGIIGFIISVTLKEK